jgi:hypothetical protein
MKKRRGCGGESRARRWRATGATVTEDEEQGATVAGDEEQGATVAGEGGGARLGQPLVRVGQWSGGEMRGWKEAPADRSEKRATSAFQAIDRMRSSTDRTRSRGVRLESSKVSRSTGCVR